MTLVTHFASQLRPAREGSRSATLPFIETMVAPRVGGAAGSSPTPQASARSGRLEAGATFAQSRRRLSIITAAAVAVLISCVCIDATGAQPVMVATPRGPAGRSAAIADFIAEASQRFDIPEGWIAAVMHVESAFDRRATSPKGAMGLMQLMPETWATMRAQLGLGSNPYDPHDNILAGAGYLRVLYDQFGAGGFLAAYNAGPGRYLDFLSRGRPLPGETRRYVAVVAPVIDGRAESNNTGGVRVAVRQSAPRPTLFAPVAGSGATVASAAPPPPERTPAVAFEPAHSTDGSLFAGAWAGAQP